MSRLEVEFRKNPKQSIEDNNDQQYKYDIIISYSYDDKDIVHQIQQYLVNQGFNVWFEDKNLHGQSKSIQVFFS